MSECRSLTAGYEFSWNARWLWSPPTRLSSPRAVVPAFSHLVSIGRHLLRIWCTRAFDKCVESAHRESCSAGLAEQGLLVVGAVLGRLHLPLIGRAGVMLFIAAMHGFEMRHLRAVYGARAHQSYELGVALARISQPSDLVITVANWTGDPVAVYYSRRHGWVFPPAWPAVNWTEDIVDESAAIQLFDRLRLNGAKWFGIVAEQRTKYHDTLPRLVAHIKSTTKLVDQNHDWSIYRILPLKPESRLNERRSAWDRSGSTAT
jgi:hypothetical protein